MTPPGIRNNNPGNIRHSSIVWDGQAAAQPDADFVSFIDPLHGIRALMKDLLSYQKIHNLETVQAMIMRWAPPVENDTGAYVRDVCLHIGVKPDDPIDLDIPDFIIRMAQAIAYHENGHCPDPTLPWWYPEDLYEEAAQLALA